MMAAMNLIMPEKFEHHQKITKQSRRGCPSDLRMEFLSQFEDREFEVAQILLNLPYLCTNSLTDFRFSCSWGSKRRRSALDNCPSPKEVVPTAPPPPPPRPTPVVKAIPKPEATSPSTPLSFCPSDSDGKSKQSTKKTSLKRTKDEWLRIIDDKLQTQQTLLKEIDEVKLHLQKLQDENSELKAKKQKLIQGSTVDVRREKTQIQLEVSEGLNNSVTACAQVQHTVVNDYISTGPSTSTLLQHQAPFIPHLIISNPTVQGGQLHYHQQQQPVRHQVGALGFDLNISAEEMIAHERAVQLQPLDHHHHRVIMMNSHTAYNDQARAARQRRIQQNKLKKAVRGPGAFVHVNPTC